MKPQMISKEKKKSKKGKISKNSWMKGQLLTRIPELITKVAFDALFASEEYWLAIG